jgi:hypothetical protein
VLDSPLKRSNSFTDKLEPCSKRFKPFSKDPIPLHIPRPFPLPFDEPQTSHGSRIGFQEVHGSISHSQVDEPVLVIAQGWPSWSFALDGLGFGSITTSAQFPSLSSKEEFKSTSLGPSLISNHSIDDWIAKHGETGLLFIQGDQPFLSSIFHRFENFDELRVVFGCSDPNFWTADGWRESHSGCGGVTNGTWTFYCQNVPLSSSSLPAISRSL